MSSIRGDGAGRGGAAPGRAVAVTGLGAVSPIGVGVRAFTRALREGRSGTRLISPDTPGRERVRSSVCAMCAEFDPSSVMDEMDQRRLPRLVPMAVAACAEAVGQAKVKSEKLNVKRSKAQSTKHTAQSEEDIGLGLELSRRVGLILGTGAGGIDFTLDQAQVGYVEPREGEPRRQPSLWTITNATHGNLAGELSIRLGLRGPSLCVSTGCASSSDAIGLALEMLRSDRPGAPEIMVVVGADAHVRWETLLGMELLRVISTRACATEAEAARASRPFDASRDGFVLGEGAWALVLERAETARAREAAPIAWLRGYGVTCDAYHRVRPAPDMEESARAMRLAVEDAGLGMGDVEVLHYHGTATALNDALETMSVKLAFGAHAARLRGHSVKSQIGHPQGAGGAAAAVATLAALTAQDGHPAGAFIPPTINLEERDPGCELEYTPNEAAATDARIAMVNCLAFGAKNSALVFEAVG